MSGVTIRDMEDIATSLPDIGINNNDFGTVIDIGATDFGGDDLGLLANTKLMSGGPQAPPQNTVSVAPVAPASGLSEVDVSNFDTLEPIKLNVGGIGDGGFSMPAVNVAQPPASSSGQQSIYGNQQSASGPSVNLTPAPQKDAQAENKEKIYYINKLARLEKRGFPVSRRFTLDNTLEEIKDEFFRLKDAHEFEKSLKDQRDNLVATTNAVEWLNNRYNYFDVELDGWSEAVYENIEEYDDIFEDLYDKYKNSYKLPPEVRLAWAVGKSAVKFHLSKMYLKEKFRGKTVEDILKNDPELARRFNAAVSTEASSQPQAPQPPQYNPNIADPGPGAFFGAAPQVYAAQEAPQQPRRMMRGPTGVDDILRTFQEVQQAQETPTSFVPPQVQSQAAAAAAAAAEIQSQSNSDDMGSVATGRTGRRGGRRKAPVENALTLNV